MYLGYQRLFRRACGTSRNDGVGAVWSSGTRNCFVALLLAMTIGGKAAHLESSLRAPRSGAWQSPRANSPVLLRCHCEARFVSRGNLSLRATEMATSEQKTLLFTMTEWGRMTVACTKDCFLAQNVDPLQ